MASNYYPRVSSSPPPFDDDDDNDEFEFGNFASADTYQDADVKRVDADPTVGEDFEPHVSAGNCAADLSAQHQQPSIHKNHCESPVSEDVADVDVEAAECAVSRDHASNEALEPRSDSGFEVESDRPMEDPITESERQVDGSEEAVSENRPVHDEDSAVSTFVGEVAITGNEDVDNLCFGERSWNAESDEDSKAEPGADVASRDGGAVSSLEDAASETIVPSVTTELPEVVEEWDRSDSSFDEFMDFQTAPVSDVPEAECPKDEPAECAESDDFDDFATFDGNEAKTSVWEVETSSTASLFVEEEFGNFNCASSAQIDQTYSDANVRADISSLLASAFPDSAGGDRPTVTVERLEEVLGHAARCEDPKSLKSLWSRLHDIDNTHALTYHWSQSQSNKKLLHSLRIDARNFLAGTKWNSSMPLFAATLGSDPLEPKRASLPGADEEGPKSIVACDISALKFGSAQETAVPPAQFDWGSSGLVNPLDGLESEFLGSASSSEGKLTGPNGASSGPSLLVDKILSQAAKSSSATYFNAHTRRRASNLSQEATRVLDTLPDLSFMRAKVLMFPIRGAL